MHSKDDSVNASLSLLKVFKQIRTLDPTYKPTSRYQARLKNKRAARRLKHGIVR
jgi:hypothetical protein